MKNAIRLPALAVAILSISSPAHAHLGHAGELAGHSHWIGLAAASAAAAIAIAVSTLGRKKEAEAKEAEAEDATDETPAEA